jgi:hypothetical protein
MSRPVTLFTGQWADLPLAELAAKCGEWGFDGLELACRGDQFDVAEARSSPSSGRTSSTPTSRTRCATSTDAPRSSALNQWEDSGMDRDWGAPDALAFVRRTDFAPSSVAFDAAFAKER